MRRSEEGEGAGRSAPGKAGAAAPPDRPAPSEERVAIGRAVAPHGVRGEVRVLPYAADLARYASLARVWIGERAYRVAEARPHKAVILLRLVGVNDRAAAERLRGLEVWVPETERAPLAPGRFYVDDLIGLAVVDLSGRERGRVRDVESLPGQDLLHVAVPGGGKDALIPMVRALVREIDPTGGRIVVDALPGLFPDDLQKSGSL